MANTIEICNVKGIKKLKFEFPTKKGLFFLVGPNGVGKTTLLICIDRLHNSYAFAHGFLHPKNLPSYDEYIGSKITYTANGQSVVFHKGKSRWTASPKKENAEFLKSFGYNGSIFIKADSARIDATQEEIRKGKVIPADQNLIQSLNEIFDTKKYDNLRRHKISKKGRNAESFYVIKDGKNFYSEKRFSTGEIALLRLIEKINNAPNKTLVLIDEAEMALHPRVQIKLMAYLRKVAKEKDLTVFVSTHSPTLIRANKPESILLLEDEGQGNYKLLTPCYPARAMGDIDYEEAKIYDFVFFVEDNTARLALKFMLNRYGQAEPKYTLAMSSLVPVGGFCETAQMAIHTQNTLLGFSKVVALVDGDAFEDLDHKPKFKELLKTHSNQIFSLGFTPELKFIEIFEKADDQQKKKFKETFHREIDSIMDSEEYLSCKKIKARQLAKDKFEVIVNQCALAVGETIDLTEDQLISFLIYQIPISEIKQTLGPIFSK